MSAFLEVVIISKLNILSGLNKEQRQPVKQIHGPLYVIAAPGAGKTRVMINRIAYMIESGVDPSEILTFTFTRKAANEIIERLQKQVGDSAAGVTVGTYHSICARLLRKHCDCLGYEPSFTIYDVDEQKKVIKKIVKNPQIKIPEARLRISEWKSNMLTPEEALKNAEDDIQRTIAGYYKEYQRRLKEQNAMDFDDLIYNMIRVLESHPDRKAMIHKKFQYILVDEFQDSSLTDIRFIMEMTNHKQNLCVVMDDEQSIYRFRGSNIDAVLSTIEHAYPFKKYILGTNFRSRNSIVGASRQLIMKNLHQVDKTVIANKDGGNPIVLYEEKTSADEAKKVVKIIKALVRTQEVQYNEIAILYRTGFLSRKIEDACLKSSIPYHIVSGVSFYDRMEIKDIMAYFRLLYNPQDEIAFMRSIVSPKRKIGERTIEKIIETKHEHDCTYIEACEKAPLKGIAKAGALQYVKEMKILEKHFSELAPDQMLQKVFDTIDYEEYLKNTEDNHEERMDNLRELKVVAQEYLTMDDFIANISLNYVAEDSKKESVNLMTMHASKGLEFKVIIIIGANEGVIPHKLAMKAEEIEEERRLFYVAMTRAEELLFITRSEQNFVYGKNVYADRSRFINEIGEEWLLCN